MSDISIRLQRADLQPAQGLVACRPDNETTARLYLVGRSRALQDHDDVVYVLVLRHRSSRSAIPHQLLPPWMGAGGRRILYAFVRDLAGVHGRLPWRG